MFWILTNTVLKQNFIWIFLELLTSSVVDLFTLDANHTQFFVNDEVMIYKDLQWT